MKAEDVVLNRLRNNNAKKIFIKDRGYDTFELFLKNLLVWYGQISSGIREILKYAHTGIKEWQNIEEREKYKQLKLLL